MLVADNKHVGARTHSDPAAFVDVFPSLCRRGPTLHKPLRRTSKGVIGTGHRCCYGLMFASLGSNSIWSQTCPTGLMLLVCRSRTVTSTFDAFFLSVWRGDTFFFCLDPVHDSERPLMDRTVILFCFPSSAALPRFSCSSIHKVAHIRTDRSRSRSSRSYICRYHMLYRSGIFSTDLTQDMFAGLCRSYGSYPATSAR